MNNHSAILISQLRCPQALVFKLADLAVFTFNLRLNPSGNAFHELGTGTMI